jgi:hypothetical protein
MSHAAIRGGTNADATHKPALNLTFDTVIECSPTNAIISQHLESVRTALCGVSTKERSEGPGKRRSRQCEVPLYISDYANLPGTSKILVLPRMLEFFFSGGKAYMEFTVEEREQSSLPSSIPCRFCLFASGSAKQNETSIFRLHR